MTDPPIVIVGAGATVALLLARRGIATAVLERREQTLVHPAAHVLNARSLEIWRQASPELAGEIAALSPPIESRHRPAVPPRCPRTHRSGHADSRPIGSTNPKHCAALALRPSRSRLRHAGARTSLARSAWSRAYLTPRRPVHVRADAGGNRPAGA
ncbi:FAD-dependent oxidoreductase [Nocardia sp. CA-120079]|uniref:FAD-dependent oxidoreductase n=1 Tax=Nocardia sp. CA-120079 TaxID=3239974 RepID=UPI003D96C5FB